MHIKSNPRTALLSTNPSGRAAGHTTRTDSCSQHTGTSRRGGHEQRQLKAHQCYRPARPRLPTAPPRVPGTRRLPATPDGILMSRQRLGVHRARLKARPLGPRRRAPPRRLPRPRESGVHRELVRQAQAAADLAHRVRDARPSAPRARRLHRRLPPPPALRAQLPDTGRSGRDLERSRTDPPIPSGLKRQRQRGAGHDAETRLRPPACTKGWSTPAGV
jgi:hypothetical protein